jgi:hypothetical protein
MQSWQALAMGAVGSVAGDGIHRQALWVASFSMLWVRQ